MALVLLGGCEGGDDPTAGLSPSRGQVLRQEVITTYVSNNGITLNGITLNGITLNGITLNGITLNGITLNGITLNGITLNGITLNGSELAVTLPSGQILTGEATQGTTFELTLDEQGRPVPYALRIDAVNQDPRGRFDDIWLYWLSYRRAGDTTWKNACQDYSGQRDASVFIRGSYWDERTGARIDNPNVIGLACSEGAVGKCVSLGYRPWAQSLMCEGPGRARRCEAVSLQDHHQACTRMIRADYCGDGRSYTLNGTAIDVWDYLAPPLQMREEEWQIEARWSPEGAICLMDQRHPELPFPGCARPGRRTELPRCSAYQSARGLLVSSFAGMQ